MPTLARVVAANQVLLPAMSPDELERAVTEPARLAGLRLEPGLTELILPDVAAEPGALPLLSHALRATWERRDGRTLTVDGYRETGGVALRNRPHRRLDRSARCSGRAATACSAASTCASPSSARARRTPVAAWRSRSSSRRAPRPRPSSSLLEQLADARLVTLDDGTAEVRP